MDTYRVPDPDGVAPDLDLTYKKKPDPDMRPDPAVKKDPDPDPHPFLERIRRLNKF